MHRFCDTRSYAALRAADLDWIVGPGYSWGGYVWGVLNVSFCASGTQLGLDFLSIDFFRIYFVSFKLFFYQIYYVLSNHNNFGQEGGRAGINKNVTDTFR